MAEITNPQVVRFCNEKCRPLANAIEMVRRTAEQFAIDVVSEFEANVGGSGSGSANSDTIADGAAVDGRSIVSKQKVLDLKYVCEQVAAALNQDDREALVHNWVVNGTPIF